MEGWLEGLKAAAEQRGRAASPSAVAKAGELPESLAALYRVMNGARLRGGVELLPLQQWSSEDRALCFGGKGADRRLWAVRREHVAALADGGEVPAWLEAIEPDAWVFAASSAQEPLRVYGTLERMLSVIVPPAPAEDFGEQTFVRALDTVREALGALASARTPKKAKPAARKAKPKRTPKRPKR